MKVKFITPDAVKAQSRGKANIRFGKEGVVAISTDAVRIMELSVGDSISIVEDEEHEGEFYICKTPKGEEGFLLRPVNGKETTLSLGFNAKGLCAKINGQTSYSVRYKLATEPTVEGKTKFYGILISSSNNQAE